MVMWIAAAIFAALMLMLSLYVLSLSGHFPPEHRAPALRGRGGATLMIACSIVAVATLGAGIAAAWQQTPLVAMIIGGGAGVLAAPLILTNFSDRFVNGRAALVVFSGSAALCAGALYAIGAT
jgi:hypothetical protein